MTMTRNVLMLGALLGGIAHAGPVSITINLSAGNFDRGVTAANVDTAVGFVTAGAACSGAGCASLSISSLNSLLLSFTVASGSLTGAGASFSGSSLTQSSDLGGFFFSGQSAFNGNSTFTENVGASGVLGESGALTGSLTLNWNGNATVQARAATGTLSLSGDVTNVVPEPSPALLLSLPVAALIALRRSRRRSTRETAKSLASYPRL